MSLTWMDGQSSNMTLLGKTVLNFSITPITNGN